MPQIPEIKIHTEEEALSSSLHQALAPVLLEVLATDQFDEYFMPGSDLVRLPNLEAHRHPSNGLHQIYVFSGYTGVGKDHLAKTFSDQAGIKLLGFGEMLAKVVGVDRDQLRNYSAAELAYFYPQVIESIIQQQPCVLTSHPVFLSDGAITFDPDIYTQLKPNYFIFVSALPPQILLWLSQRNACGERTSPLASLQDIDLFQRCSFVILNAYSEQSGAGLITIQNTPSAIDENLALLKSVFCPSSRV